MSDLIEHGLKRLNLNDILAFPDLFLLNLVIYVRNSLFSGCIQWILASSTDFTMKTGRFRLILPVTG